MNNLEKLQRHIHRKTGDMDLPNGLSQEFCDNCTAEVLDLVDQTLEGRIHNINVRLRDLLRDKSRGINLED